MTKKLLSSALGTSTISVNFLGLSHPRKHRISVNLEQPYEG